MAIIKQRMATMDQHTIHGSTSVYNATEQNFLPKFQMLTLTMRPNTAHSITHKPTESRMTPFRGKGLPSKYQHLSIRSVGSNRQTTIQKKKGPDLAPSSKLL